MRNTAFFCEYLSKRVLSLLERSEHKAETESVLGIELPHFEFYTAEYRSFLVFETRLAVNANVFLFDNYIVETTVITRFTTVFNAVHAVENATLFVFERKMSDGVFADDSVISEADDILKRGQIHTALHRDVRIDLAESSQSVVILRKVDSHRLLADFYRYKSGDRNERYVPLLRVLLYRAKFALRTRIDYRVDERRKYPPPDIQSVDAVLRKTRRKPDRRVERNIVVADYTFERIEIFCIESRLFLFERRFALAYTNL